MAAAVTFARSDQSLRVADDAIVVRDTERGLASAATYRANLTIAVVAAAAQSPASSARAMSAANGALERIVGATTGASDVDLDDLTRRLTESHDRVSEALATEDISTADDIVSTETLPILDAIQQNLATRSASAAARIDAEKASAGRTARASSFVVALIVPMLALWAYRQSVQRKLERERLASELARQRDLATAQQNLISGMSHQLRTPLTGIYGFAEALVSDAAHGKPDPGFVSEAGTTILGEANRLRGMVDDILVTARHHADDLAYEHAPFRLNTEIEAVIDPFRTTGATITAECEEAELVCDRLRLRHVLRNLIDNGLRHGQPPVVITGHHEADGYLLSIVDHGEGPPEGVAFRPFVHTGEEALVTGSLGLGLGVCRTLCDGMGIDLSFDRQAGTSRFTLRFGPDMVVTQSVGEPVTVRP